MIARQVFFCWEAMKKKTHMTSPHVDKRSKHILVQPKKYRYMFGNVVTSRYILYYIEKHQKPQSFL